MRLGLAGLPSDDLEWIVGSIQGRVHDLAESRILVTGASGFIGRWIVASLVEVRRQLDLPGMAIDVLVRDPLSARDRLGSELWGELEVIEGDVNSAWQLDRPVTHAIHGATPSSARSASASGVGVLVTSVVGTHNLIRALEAQRSGRPRVLHLSSGAVYGAQPASMERIPESWPGGPSIYDATAPYAEGKRSAEALLQEASRAGNVEAVQARLFAFLGPGLPLDEGYAIGNFAGQAARGESIVVRGDGSVVRSYLVARDLALWLLLLLLNAESGIPYNVGSPDARTLREWAQLCAALGNVSVIFGTESPGERSLYVPDVSNSRSLGIKLPESDVVEGLESWMKWLHQVNR